MAQTLHWVILMSADILRKVWKVVRVDPWGESVMSSLPPTCHDCVEPGRGMWSQETRNSGESGSVLALCFARYLSLYFFFFPKGLQLGASLGAEWAPLATRLEGRDNRGHWWLLGAKALGHLPVRSFYTKPLEPSASSLFPQGIIYNSQDVETTYTSTNR